MSDVKKVYLSVDEKKYAPASKTYQPKQRTKKSIERPKRKYYRVGEIVFVKQYKVRGTVMKLDIRPQEHIYHVRVKFFDGNGVEWVKVFDAWDIDKVTDLDYNHQFNKHSKSKSERKPRVYKTQQTKLGIKVKYQSEDIQRIEKIPVGDWIDLRASETMTIAKGFFALVPLGVAMQLPKGYEAHIAPRSSTFKNFGIIQTNSVGVVDESYCGDNDWWFEPVYALRDTVINAGDRICQFRIVKKMEPVNFIEVEVLGNKDRGGHGTTGKR